MMSTIPYALITPLAAVLFGCPADVRVDPTDAHATDDTDLSGPTGDTDGAGPADLPLFDVGDDVGSDGVVGPSDSAGETSSDTSDVETDAAQVCTEGAPCTPNAGLPSCTEGRCNALGTCVVKPIAGCCERDLDCSLIPVNSACEVQRCHARTCVQVRFPGCCQAADACDDANPATLDTCNENAGLCRSCDQTGCAPGDAPLFVATFDAVGSLTAAGFTVTDSRGNDGVGWQRDGARWAAGGGAAYLGRPACRTYFSGELGGDCTPTDPFHQDAEAVDLQLRTPWLELPVGGSPVGATFWLWAEVEPIRGGQAETEPDVLRVVVEPADSPPWEVATSLVVGKSTGGAWRQLAVDLSPWRGQRVRLNFDFNTFDGQSNLFEGVYLDELRIAPSCVDGGCCTTDADCGAAAGSCAARRCQPQTSGVGAVCSEGPRTPNAACEPCETPGPGGCDDGDPCTADRCDADLTCVHARFCCIRSELSRTDFDETLDPWTVSDPHPDDGAGWHVSAVRASEGPGSAWAGIAGSDTYDTGDRVVVSLTSPPLILPDAQHPLLDAATGLEVAFGLNLSTEWDLALAYDNPRGVDRLSLSAVVSGVATEIWSSDVLGGTTRGVFEPIAVSLDTYAGRSVQLRFVFDTVDGEANAFGGPYLDTVTIRTRCAP